VGVTTKKNIMPIIIGEIIFPNKIPNLNQTLFNGFNNLEVRNAKSIIVKKNNKIKFNLLYDKNRSLQKKIKIEQIRKEIKIYYI